MRIRRVTRTVAGRAMQLARRGRSRRGRSDVLDAASSVALTIGAHDIYHPAGWIVAGLLGLAHSYRLTAGGDPAP